jgi:methylmalonyl-CoA/ethylmalonyl-CoA epimerase
MEKDWKFSHVGIVVKDWKKTMEYYMSLGIFDIPPQDEVVMEGKKIKIIGADIFLGPLWIEVFQPVSGDSLQQKFLDEHGEGLNHIGYEVPDLQKARAIMTAKGVPVAFHIKDRATYYQTGESGNMLIELLQSPEPERVRKGRGLA